MPNTREKLIELICDANYDITRICVNRDWCDGCPAEYGKGQCKEAYIADHLIAHGVTVQKWIPVTERLPDTAERVLVCKTWLGRVYKPVYGYYRDFPNQKGCWYVLTDDGYYPQREVTHWMPLPEPPKGE